MNVTVFGPNLPRSLSDKGDMVAHRTGCADTAKGVYRRLHSSQVYSFEAATIEDIVDDVYGGFGEYEGTDDPEAYAGYRGGITVFPCVDLPEHASPSPAAPR